VKCVGDYTTNYTAKDIRRIDLVVGVSYGADIDHVRKVVSEVLDKDERVLDDPKYQIEAM
jgi:small conductance mechanosensitive channel